MVKNNNRIMKSIERVGNALPHPAALFGIFALTTLLFSAIGYWLDWSGVNPASGESIHVINLISKEGLHKILL